MLGFVFWKDNPGLQYKTPSNSNDKKKKAHERSELKFPYTRGCASL